MFKDSATSNEMKLSRTKCAAIIRNGWSPYFIGQLQEDISHASFSLLIDESTDIGVVKFLGIVIKYFSKSSSNVVTIFLKLAELKQCDAEAIVAAIKATLREYKLDIQKLVGIGTDNASVMTGRLNGVYAKLKLELPELILVPCIFHSLQLAVSECCKSFLPQEMEYLIAVTYNWFARSSSRQSKYKQLYQTLNEGHSPLKIVQSCATRWLSIETAVTRVLDQWLELKTHFEISSIEEHCYMANQLKTLFNDEFKKSYLLFVQPYLKEFQTANKLFQSGTADMTKMFDDFYGLLERTVYTIVTKRKDFDPVTSEVEDYLNPNITFNYMFEKHVQQLRQSNKLSFTQEKNLRSACTQLVVGLVKSLRERFPRNLELLRSIKLLSIHNTLRPVKQKSLVPLMEELQMNPRIISKVELQWNSIHLNTWNTSSTVAFWGSVLIFSDSCGSNPYEDLARFATKMLAVPLSNADVERTFKKPHSVSNVECYNYSSSRT